MLQGQVVCLLCISFFILYCVHHNLNTTKSLSHSQLHLQDKQCPTLGPLRYSLNTLVNFLSH